MNNTWWNQPRLLFIEKYEGEVQINQILQSHLIKMLPECKVDHHQVGKCECTF